MIVRILTFLIIGLALFVTGCGGDEPVTTEEPGTTQEPVTEQTPEAPAGGAESADPAGKAQFATTCGTCHTLSDAGTNGQIGPNLDEVAPDVEEVLTAIETGPGQMPENLLVGENAREVAEYVAANAGG